MARYDAYFLRVWRNSRADGPNLIAAIYRILGARRSSLFILSLLAPFVSRGIGVQERDEPIDQTAAPGHVVMATAEFGIGHRVAFRLQYVAKMPVRCNLPREVSTDDGEFQTPDLQIEAHLAQWRRYDLPCQPFPLHIRAGFRRPCQAPLGSPPVRSRLGERSWKSLLATDWMIEPPTILVWPILRK
jgi:hypothetical protein